MVAAVVGGLMVASVLGMSIVKKQFFPISDRPEVMVEVQMPYGTSIGQTSETTRKVEAWLLQQPESEIVDRKSTRLNSSHLVISYAVFCLKHNDRRTP